MAGLFRTFNVGATGLRVSQTGLATVGHNIANADTEGYSRQRVSIEALRPARVGAEGSFLGQGARVESITRANDRFLELQARRDRTLLGFYEGRERTLDAVERLFVEGGEPTVGHALDAFFNAARALSQEPDDPARRAELLTAAERVAGAFRTLDADLREVQRGVDDDLSDRLDRVNELARTIADMNARIVASESGGAEASDFRDRRDQAVRELSSLVDVNVLEQKDGSVTVEIAGQWTLVQGDLTARLETLPNAANQGLFDVVYVGVNGQSTNITADLDQGEIGGLLDVRDRILGGQLTALDQMAFELVGAVNAVHRAGFGLDGVNNRDLFVPLGAPGFAAANIAVDPAVLADPDRVAAAGAAAGVPGDNRNALALAALETQGVAGLGNVTFARRYAEVLHDVGREAADNRGRREVQEVRRDQSEALRESVEGVSIDDEMIDLTRFQKHFEANTRVVSTVDRLLDAVLALVS